MPYNNANEAVVELFKSIISRYQNSLGKSMKWSDFIFDSIQLMYYECHKVNFRQDGSYIDSPDCIKKERTTINLKSRW